MNKVISWSLAVLVVFSAAVTAQAGHHHRHHRHHRHHAVDQGTAISIVSSATMLDNSQTV
jgi:hypothetical protein